MPKFQPLRRSLAVLAVLFGFGTGVPAPAAAQRIENTATLRWTGDGAPRALRSNTVALDVGPVVKRPTKISFRLLPTDYELTGMQCQTSPTVQFTPAPIDAALLAKSPPLSHVDLYEPMVIVLDAAGENHDPTVRETTWLDVQAGDKRPRLPLLETAPDSGVFAGGVPGIGMDDHPEVAGCDLDLQPGDRLTLSFAGDDDDAASSASLLIDPIGTVFDSQTGLPVDGATIELVDAEGRPASVFGDDGVSAYPSVMVSGSTVTDASGRRYPGRAGLYRFPLVAPGEYRLRITPPSPYSAPSAVDPATLAALSERIGVRYEIVDASYGRPFTLVDEILHADIPLDPPATLNLFSRGSLLLAKTAAVREAAPGDVIQYRLRVTNRDTRIARGVRIDDALPLGLGYRRGSVRGGGEPTVATDGRHLAFTLPDLAPGATAELSYSATVRPGAPVGEAVNRARVAGQGIDGNEAAASVRLRPLLFSDALTVIGRVTEGACGDPAAGRRGIPGIRLVTEEGIAVVTDRDGLYHLEGLRPGTHVVQLDPASIPASHRAIACDADTRQGGNPLSRFVEGTGGLLKRVDFQLVATGRAVAAAAALPVQVADDAAAAGNRDWLAGQVAGIAWLFPEADHNPRAPAIRVVVKHHPSQRVRLTLNGAGVEAMTFDGSDTAGPVAVSRWTGVALRPGENRLVATVLEADGRVAATLDRIVHFAGVPASAVVDPALSRLVADGLAQPLVAVRLRDAAGRPVRAGTVVPFKVAAPHRAALDPTAGTTAELATARVVGDDGIAFFPLQPTAQAGAVRLSVTLADAHATRNVPLDAWLTPGRQDWMVVGFGRGSIGWNALRRHVQAMPRGERETITTDGQVALYAKGRVRGEWLLTLAYDSDRKRDRLRGLHGTIDPDRYYTVYGDGTEQRYDAASSRPLYLRLERRQFYALFGDFETGLVDAQLTRYARSLNGMKAAYEGRTVRATAIAARTSATHARDELRGLGLTGPYRLSRRNIVPNSDRVVIQVRDRFRPELVTSETPMVRHIDYDIDVDLGTLRFRTPVLSRAEGLNPVYIVADYEVEAGRAGRPVAAGRAATRLFDRTLEVGVGAIRDAGEGAGEGAAALAGLDLRWRPTAATEVRAEAAHGGRYGIGEGFAYLVEAEHHGAALDLSAYVRRQDTGFGIGQQNLVEAGTRRTGLDARVQLAPALTLTGTGWYQEQLDGPGRRLAGETRAEWRRDGTTLFAGTQFAQDRGLDGDDRRSTLLTLGGQRALFGERLTVTAQTQVAPGGDKAAADFPIRHQISAGVRVLPGVRLIGGWELAEGADYRARTVQGGVDIAPWAGGKVAATLNGQAAGENGERTFAQYGISQSLPLGPRWTVDASLDAATTLSGRVDPRAAVTPFQSAAGGILGQDANLGSFTAVTLGTAYRSPLWSGTLRLEYRDATVGDRWGITGGLVRTLGEGRTLAGSVKAYSLSTPNGAGAGYASADVALAWRPLDSRWSILDRLEVRRERADAGVGDGNGLGVPALAAAAGDGQASTRVVNNLSLNWRSGPEGLGHGMEATLYHGAKYVAGRYGDDRYTGFIDATGFELRADLHPRVDMGVQVSAQHAWQTGSWAWSAGPSVGLSPARDVWVSVGANLAGYRDRDFEGDRYTRAGPYVTLRMKFDRGTLGGKR